MHDTTRAQPRFDFPEPWDFNRAAHTVRLARLPLGGKIAGYTPTMTTTIALETSKGNFGLALGLGSS